MAEAKTTLNLPSWVREMDACCSRGHRFASKPSKNHTWDQDSLPFHSQEAQAMPPHRSKPTKTKKPCRDYQKSRHNRNCCNCGLCSSRSQSSISATRFNTTKTPTRNDYGRNQPVRWEDRDLSRTTCYNYNKKGHFANKCPKPRKPKN